MTCSDGAKNKQKMTIVKYTMSVKCTVYCMYKLKVEVEELLSLSLLQLVEGW
jgi:hypothetical protein